MKYFYFIAWVIVPLLSNCDSSEKNGSIASTADSSFRDSDEDEDNSGDIALTEADLEPGQAGVCFIYTPPGNDNESVELTLISNEAFIYYDEMANMCPPGWGLKVPIKSDELTENGAIFLWFNDTDTDRIEMAVGESEAAVISVDLPPVESGGKTWEPEGIVTITETTGRKTSGWWRGNENISIAFYAPDAPATGEIFQVKAFVFSSVETQIPVEEAPCYTPPPRNTSDGG